MASDDRPPVPPLLGIGFAIVIVSSASILTRYAQTYAPSLVIAASRLTIASLVLTPVLVVRESATLKSLSRNQLWLALASGFFLALHFATWIPSLEYTTVASSVVLVSTMPLFVALLAPWTLHEPLTRPVIIGLALALVGGVAIGLSDACTWEAGLRCPSLAVVGGPSALLGDVLAVAGALAGAGYFLIGRHLRKTLPLLTYIGLSYGTGALVLLGMMILAGQTPFGLPPIGYILFILLALGPQLLGHSSFNWAIRYLPAALLSVTLLGEPVGSSILAFFIFHERPTSVKLIAFLLILLGIYIASRAQPEAVHA